MFLDKNLSIYLDVIRFIAAISVVLGHMEQDGLFAAWLPISEFSHQSVIYFFVLSGLVISNAVLRREGAFPDYAAARISRIYSVVVPAVALSFLVKGGAAYIEGGRLLEEYLRDDFKIYNVIGSLLFVNESWLIPTSLPWNNPFWSLCYEVWFYVFFGVMLFMQGKWRWAALVACMLVAGPSIALMFPIWLMGVWLSKNGEKFVPRTSLAILLWILSFFAIKFISDTNFDIVVQFYLHEHVPGYWRLKSAQRFPTDYVVGFCVVINIAAFRGFADHLGKLMNFIKPAAMYLAGFTFSIYLYHRPITTYVGHFFPNTSENRVLSIVTLFGVVVACMLLSAITEQKRELLARPLRHWLGAKKRCSVPL